jgi:hypothetical protein
VKEEKEVKNEPTPAQPAEPPAPAEQVTTEQETATTGSTRSETGAVEAADEQPTVVHDLDAAPEGKMVEERPAPAPENIPDLAKAEDLAAATSDGETKAVAAPASGALALDTVTFVPGTATHVVTGNELTYNFSAADATQAQTLETVSVQSARRFADREKAKKSETRTRTVAWADDKGEATADASVYIDLLRAAW